MRRPLASGPTAATSGSSPPEAELRAWRRRLRRVEPQRDLPWRGTRDAWAILVAEVMLQQTQVVRVVPAWERFLDRFPDPARLASADRAEVILFWEGMGYHRRAVALHRCAREVVERHGGRLPDDLEELLGLPGVGPYTARALLAFAFERDVAVVDTNVARILARAVADAPLAPRAAQQLADRLVTRGRGWAHNQAMLDLGAVWCRPRPRCEDCPLQRSCSWRRRGLAEPDPAKGSAGVSRPQARFEGSDRQRRGRILAAAREAAPSWASLELVDGEVEVLRRLAADLAAEGLVELDASGSKVRLAQG